MMQGHVQAYLEVVVRRWLGSGLTLEQASGKAGRMACNTPLQNTTTTTCHDTTAADHQSFSDL